MTDSYELAVIGAGPAGGAAVKVALEAGASVALVERDRLGGTCLNYGCDPTKVLTELGTLIHAVREGRRHGLRCGDATGDWAAARAWVAQVVETIRGGSEADARERQVDRGVALYLGDARFEDPHTLTVGDRRLRAEQIVIATGSEDTVPDLPGLREAGYLTNQDAINLEPLPRRLLVLGGGSRGIEFAQIYLRFGVEVAIIDKEDRLMPNEDAEVAERLSDLLRAEGLRIETGLVYGRVDRGDDGLAVECACHDRRESFRCDAILLAAGRAPRVAGLGLEAVGVRVGDEGIEIDEHFRTSVPHIWAAGDVVGGAFTHVASEHGKLAARNALLGERSTFDHFTVPYAMFSDPELGRVGYTEEQAKLLGLRYRVGRCELSDLVRAIQKDRTQGFVKLLIGEDDRLLGAHVLAPGAGDLIAPAVLAMRCGLPASQLYETLLPYPTLVEAVRWAAKPAEGGRGKGDGGRGGTGHGAIDDSPPQ